MAASWAWLAARVSSGTLRREAINVTSASVSCLEALARSSAARSRATRAVEIELHEDGQAVRAALTIANRVDTVPVGERDLPRVRRGAIDYTSAHAGIPVALLAEFVEIIDVSCRRESSDPPVLAVVDREIVVGSEQDE